MNYFKYINNELYCEQTPVRSIAEEAGTPVYIYSSKTLKRHFFKFKEAFSAINPLICFSAKANSSLAVLKLLGSFGAGLDIVSRGELYKGLHAEIDPQKIVYSGVGKRIDEIDYALSAGILMFNVESIEELKLIDQRAKTAGKQANAAMRVNPDIDAGTHPYISTGLKENKFGIDTVAALKGYEIAKKLKNVNPVGIACHIGSQITDVRPFKEAVMSLKNLIRKVKEIGINIKYLDIGGGLGIAYEDEAFSSLLEEYAKTIYQCLEGENINLILEPGRVIAGNAGILTVKVLYKKERGENIFIVTDGGMNDLLRPSLYKAFHNIVPVVKPENRNRIKADIVGPICESGDFFARKREISDIDVNELAAVMSAGAYGYVMASNYCARLKPAEVMVKDDEFFIIRERENYEDLIRGESIPAESSYLNLKKEE